MVFVAGDPYYEEMSVEETVSKFFLEPESPEQVLSSQAEVDMYIADNIGQKMPADGPLVRVYLQRY